jgi:hypothetical protein
MDVKGKKVQKLWDLVLCRKVVCGYNTNIVEDKDRKKVF